MVKKLIFLLFIVNLSVVNAQVRIRLGAHFDPVVSWFSTKSSDIDKDGARPGYNGGLIVEGYFSPNYAFVTGLSLTQLGGNLLYHAPVTITTGKGDDVILPAETTVAYNIKYLTFPAALKLRSNQIGYFNYFAQLGLLPQVNIGSRATATGSLLIKDNVSKEINLFNLSFYFGGGIEYNIGGQTFLLAGLFFNNGFFDVLSSSRQKSSLNFLTIQLGMMF
jgi:hypothetical protein